MKSLAAGLALLSFAAPVLAQTPPDRPNYFGLYPPPPPGTFTPTRPPASTATRRPDLFAPVPVYPHADSILYDGALDLRGRLSGRSTRGTYVAAGRLTIDYIRANRKDGDERGGARVQVLAETESVANTTPNRIRLSEVYGFYKFLFPGVSATIRAGQFVLPFGLAAVYDTPLQPIQPLYEKSVGLRVDSGVMLEGEYGPYHYAAAVTTGAGPNRRDFDSDRVVVVRLDRHFLTQSGRIQIGGSMLSGRLPVTSPDYTLPASGTSSSRTAVDKTRFAADAQYFLAKLMARGEIVFGANDQDPVFGYFAETQYGFARGLTVVGEVKRWDFGKQSESTTVVGAGINVEVGGGLTLRTLYEYERRVPQEGSGTARSDSRLILQTRFNF